MADKNSNGKHWLRRLISGGITGLLGVGVLGASGISNLIDLASAGGVGGFGMWLPWVFIGALLAGTGGILVRSGIKRHTISKRKNNEKEIESVETEVKEKSEVTKTMSKSLVKETKLDNNKDTSKDHSMQSFLAPSVDKCTFVVYEADGVNVMKTNGKEMIYRITGDQEYEACLKNEIGNFLVSSDSKSCKIDVFGPDAKKNSEGKLVGESFEFHAYDYRTQFKKFIDYVGGISKSLRAEEEDVMLKAA